MSGAHIESSLGDDSILNGAHLGHDPAHEATVLAACQQRWSGDVLADICAALGIGGA